MRIVTQFCRTHRVALVIAFLLGLVYASHHFFIPNFFLDSDRETYEPITRADYFDEALLYAPRAHDAFLNFGVRGDISLVEYPKSPAILPMLSPLLLGGLGKIFGSFNAGIIASDVLFPSAIFFIIYLIFYEIGISVYASLFFATIFLITPQLGISLPPIHGFQLQTIAQSIFPFLTKSDALYFSHFEEPKLTFVFFAVCIYAVMCALKRKDKGSILFAGISFGILFYTYLYDWATTIVALGLMAIFFLIKKEYQNFKIIIIIVGIGLFISSYYWINFFMLRNITGAHDVIARLGGEFSHSFRFASVWKSYIRALALVGFLWICMARQMRQTVVVISAVLLSYFVVVNEQIITGFNIQPDHWYRVQFLPISISIFLIGWWLWNRFVPLSIKKYERILCTLYIGYALVSMLAGQYFYSWNMAPAFALPHAYAQGFEWLDKNIEQEVVVGTFSFNGNLDVQLHTKHKIFLPFGLSTVAPEEEIWHRYMLMGKLYGIDEDMFKEIKQGGGANYLFGDQYGTNAFDANFFGYSWRIPDDMLEEKTRSYRELLATQGPLIIPYRLDFLFVDKKEFPSWKEPHEFLPNLKKVFENERVIIFQVNYSIIAHQ